MTIKKFGIILLVTLALTISQKNGEYVQNTAKEKQGCESRSWLTNPKYGLRTKQQNSRNSLYRSKVSPNKTTPQSGMNTVGLVFSRLTSYYPAQNNPFSNRLKITNEADYLSKILQKCATVKEVKKHIEQYDHSFFLNDVFIYIDSLGDYLIVEPYSLIEGNNPNYVLANFCPSITDNKQARKLERYRNGEDFLKTNKAIASLDFCTALSDTMSVCRSRKGDGTLITSIFDTKEKLVHLCFYHNFDTLVQYSLLDELSKGDHTLNLPEIFPKNSEFERLVNFKTPSNSVELRILLLLIAVLLSMISLLCLFHK